MLASRSNQAPKVRSTQAAVGSPFQKPHLAVQLRLDPSGPFAARHDRLAARLPAEPLGQLSLGFLGEARGQFRHVPERSLPLGGDQQTPDSPPRRRVADDDAGQNLERFDLAARPCPRLPGK